MNQPHNPYGGPQGQQHNPYGGQPQQAGWGQQPQQPQGQWGQQPQGQQWGQQPQQPQGQQWGQQPQPQHPQAQWNQNPQGQWGGQAPGYPAPHEAPHGFQQQGYAVNDEDAIAAEASPQARAKFIERTYMHLAGAIILFVLLSTGMQYLPFTQELSIKMAGNWYLILIGFIGVSWIADRWSRNATSLSTQYLGLALYTVAEVVIFTPLIWMALQMDHVGTQGILTAGVTTLAVFAGLTGYVFLTKKDFSFMRGMLAVLSMGALGLIFGGMIFGFQLGLLFSVGMVVLAGGYILYYTSNVLHHYRTTQHVAAALALFSAVALLFWYILRIFMRR